MIPEVRDDICAVMRMVADNAIPNRVYRDDPRYGWENYWRINAIAATTVVNPPPHSRDVDSPSPALGPPQRL
jgi:hypothetical protein